MTKHELAARLDLKGRQIDNLVAEGMPRTKVGRSWVYEADAEAWYWRRKAEMAGSVKRGQLDAAKMRRELAQAELAELEVALRKRSQYPLEDVRAAWVSIAETFRIRCLAVPGRWAHRVDAVRGHGPARQLLIGLIDELLTALQHDFAGIADHGGNGKRRPGRPRGPGRTAGPRARRPPPPPTPADGQ